MSDTGDVYVWLASGRRVFVDVDGAGLVPEGPTLRRRPTLVLVRGSEVDHSFFKPWVEPLTAVAQLVYVDLIGHGRSDGGDHSDWSISAWADSVAEACSIMGVGRPTVLGSSLGGRIALAMAIRHPDLVAALIVVNAVLQSDPEHRIEMFRRLGGDEAAAVARYDLEHRSAESREPYMRVCMPLTVQRPNSPEELARLRPVSPDVMDALVEISKATPMACRTECTRSSARRS